MGLSAVAIKDTGTALDIILELFGLPAVCKNVSTGIALIKEVLVRESSPDSELKELFEKIAQSIENIAKTEASSDVQVVLYAVKESFEKFKQDVKNEGKDVNNIFTDNINSPNVLINKIYDENTSLDGEAKECYQSIIRMTIEALCKPENVELFINQNHALVRLLQEKTEIFE